MKNLNFILAFILAFLPSLTTLAQITAVQEQVIDKNYVTNGGFENSVAGYKAYKNTAQALPTTGTGGTPAVTITSSTSSPISGKASGILTKGASNLQGEGVSIPFTVDSAAKGRVLTISAFYQIISGTYSGGSSATDSDVEVYVYDVDAAQIVMPAGYKLDGGVSGFNYPIAATFQTNTTSTNYRLLFHVATTSASAYQLKLDQIKVGIQNRSQGPPVTDWQTYSMVITGTTSNPTKAASPNSDLAKWRRVGDSVEIFYNYAGTGGTAGSGTYLFSLPPGISLDTTKQPASTNAVNSTVGYATVYDGVNPQRVGSVTAYDTSHLAVATLSDTQSFNFISSTIGPLSGSVNYSFFAKVPIQGWASTVTMSDSADTRVVAASYYASANNAVTANQAINFDTKIFDTHGAVTTGSGNTWKFVAPVPGYYELAAKGSFVSGGQTPSVYKNGVAYTQLGTLSTSTINAASALVMLNAGDYVSLNAQVTDTIVGGALSGASIISIKRLSGPSQIAATESIAAVYNASGGTIPNTAYSAATTWSKINDDHSIFNASTGVGVIPSPGTYCMDFTGQMTFVAGGLVRANAIFKNGSPITQDNQPYNATGSGAFSLHTHICYPFKTGDTFSPVYYQDSGSSTTLSSGGIYNTFSIVRVGN